MRFNCEKEVSMEYEDLSLEKEDGIATITLNLPDKLNAFTPAMTKSLLLAADDIAEDDEARVVIVTGAGRGFCSGADMSGGGGATAVSQYGRLQVQHPGRANVFPRMSKPVIAAVNGACVGAGFSIAMSCDIRIASETARFGAAGIAVGLAPDNGLTYYLPLVIGVSRAMELMYTGEIINAAEAEQLGIVSRVVPPDDLMKVTRELAAKITQKAPIPVSLTKKMVWRGLFDNLNRQLDLETNALQICHQTEDYKEGVSAFREKRPAQFKGR
jgi:enoyl-CoA hydratase/carnithine racemase